MSRYLDLYNHLKNVGCSATLLQDIKSTYRQKIASTRQLDRCKSLGDVLALLDKRDEINPDNYEILEELYVIIRDSSESHRPTAPPLEDLGQQDVRVLPAVPNQLYDRVQHLISNRIGYNWKNFARGLKIPEGQIDELEDRHQNISDRVRDILVYHDQFCPQNFRNSYLFNALCYARRRDLANAVQHIIDTQ